MGFSDGGMVAEDGTVLTQEAEQDLRLRDLCIAGQPTKEVLIRDQPNLLVQCIFTMICDVLLFSSMTI